MEKNNVIIYLDNSLFKLYRVTITEILKENPLKQKQMAVKFIKIKSKVETYVKFVNLNLIELQIIKDWIEYSPYSPLLLDYVIV